jgi:RHS repeat-associated protein
VRTIYDGQKSLAWNGPYHSAPSISAEMAHSTGLGTDIADTTLYYHGDQIGSARVMTDANGYLVWQATYLPYGGEFNPEPTNNHYKFTGKERDPESGLDYFGARYYKSAFGRFMTPDWSASATAVPYAEFGEPQSLNLYSYVRNSPVERVDKDGHCCDEWWQQQMIIGALKEAYNVPTDALNRVMAIGMGLTGAGGSEIPQLPLFEMDNGAQELGAGGVDVIIATEATTAEEPTSGTATDGAEIGSTEGAEQTNKKNTPTEPYNREQHYGRTPTSQDRKAVGGESVDHDPPLVKRYYEGDPKKKEPPGHTQTAAQRRTSANDQTRMKQSTKKEQQSQGGKMSQYSQKKKKELGLVKKDKKKKS